MNKEDVIKELESLGFVVWESGLKRRDVYQITSNYITFWEVIGDTNGIGNYWGFIYSEGMGFEYNAWDRWVKVDDGLSIESMIVLYKDV